MAGYGLKSETDLQEYWDQFNADIAEIRLGSSNATDPDKEAVQVMTNPVDSSLRNRTESLMRLNAAFDEYIAKPATEAVDSDLVEAVQSRVPGGIDTFYGFNTDYLNAQDPEMNQKMRKRITKKMMQLQSGDFAIKQQLDRFAHRDDNVLEPTDAQEYGKLLDADLKYSKPVTAFQVERDAEIYNLKKQYEATQAFLYQVGGDYGAFKNASVMGSAIAGSMGPVELASTMVLSAIAFPTAGVAAVSKGTSAIKKAAKLKAVSDIAKEATMYRNANMVQKAIQGAGSADDIAAAGLFIDKANKVKATKSNLKLLESLEALEGMTYESAPGWGKLAAELAGFGAIDANFIANTKRNSDEMGVELYSSKEAMSDLFMSMGLGVIGIPTVGRAIGRRMGFLPAKRREAIVRNMRRNIDAREATGELSPGKAAQIRKSLDDVEKSALEMNNMIRKPPEKVQKLAQTLERSPEDDETIVAQWQYVVNSLMKGSAPSMDAMPRRATLFTRFGADTLENLREFSVVDVFGDTLVERNIEGKAPTVVVGIEEGYFGKHAMSGLTMADAQKNLENAYKGHVLGDRQSVTDLKLYAQRYNKFLNDMEDLLADVREKVEANKAAKEAGTEATYGVREQTDLKRKMFSAYAEFRGVSADDVDSYISSVEAARATGQVVPEDTAMRALVDEFNEWADAWVVRHNINTNPRYKEKWVWDFVDTEGNIDNSGKAFENYLTDSRMALEEMNNIVEADRYFERMLPDRMKKLQEDLMHFDVPQDTDLNNLMGHTRTTFKEAVEREADLTASNNVRIERELEFAKTVNDKSTAKTFRMFLNQSTQNPKTGSLASNYNSGISRINALRRDGFASVRQTLSDLLKSNANFSEKAMAYAVDGVDNVRSLKEIYRQTLNKVLNAEDLSKFLGSNKKAVLDRATRAFEDALKKDRKVVTSLLSGEAYEAFKEVPEFAGYEQASIAARAEKLVSADKLMAPFVDSLAYGLNQYQIEGMHYLVEGTRNLGLMLKYPQIAAEIPVSLGTQSVYIFENASRSIENQTKTAGAYYSDLQNQIVRLGEYNGQTYYDYWKNPANRQDIISSLIRKRRTMYGVGDPADNFYREAYSGDSDLIEGIAKGDASAFNNTMADQIADVILNQEASFAQRFRMFGADFRRNISNIMDRSKIRFGNNPVSGVEINKVVDDVAHSAGALDSDGVNLGGFFNMAEDGSGYVRGAEAVSSKEAFKALTELQTEVRALGEAIDMIGNDRYKSMTAWALRDFDFDAMIDPGAASPMSINRVVDAMKTGDWAQIFQGDVQNAIYATQVVRRLQSVLFGREGFTKAVPGFVPTEGWAFKYIAGFNDLSAVTSGQVSHALDELQGGIRFRTASAEIEAMQKYGHDTLEQYIMNNYRKMFSAYYALQNCTSNPGAFIDELVLSYNNAIKTEEVSKRLAKLARSTGRDPEKIYEKFAITAGGYTSLKNNLLMAAGLVNTTPSTAVRILKTIKNFASPGLLAKAGLKSFSDFSTIWQGLITNGLANSTWDAATTTGKAAGVILKDRKILNLFLASTALAEEDMFRMLTNTPEVNIRALGENATLLDKVENASQKWASGLMNGFFRVGPITNFNKNSAALGIQMAIADRAGESLDQLGDFFKMKLMRDGISSADWDFFRKSFVVNAADYVKEQAGISLKGADFNIFNPMAMFSASDEVFEKELRARGVKNITPAKINDFKHECISKAYVMVDAAADEMVSIPSQRVQNILRAGQTTSSGWGAIADVATQYQSFGLSLVYSTYGRRLGALAGQYTGISIIDLINPRVDTGSGSYWQMVNSMGGCVAQIALGMLIIDTIAQGLSGQLQMPIDKKGNIHPEFVLNSLYGSIGIGGVLMDSLVEAIDGSGMGQSGVSIQVAPAISSLTGTGYRLTRPLRSDKVKNKGEALGASFVQELARYGGVARAPLVGLVYQGALGAYLEEMARGSQGYKNYLQGKERRGMLIFPWERHPEPIWERLQNY